MVDAGIKEILNLLFGSYKAGTDISTETMTAYSLILSDIPIPALKAGVMKCITTCKFLPSIAEIREASIAFYEDVTDSKQKTHAEAWNEVLKNIASVGYYGTPEWSAAEIKQAVESIGYINLCVMEQEQVPIYAAQFRGIYNQICAQKQARKEHQKIFNQLSQIDQKRLKPAESFIRAIGNIESLPKEKRGGLLEDK